jgi:hypothetical protein
MRATSDELGFNTAHKPGALARYFAERWLKEPSAQGERIIAWLLEAALGRNVMYFIEKTKEYVDAWEGSGEVVPENAFDGFAITGDPVEDTIIPHAVLVWTCMNDQPWWENVYHRWLDKLLADGSAEAAYLAASLWPAHDLMEKVTYRPARWLVYRGQLDAEAERLILTEMLKGASGPRTSLYGSFEYDDATYPELLPEQYIFRHGFTHPICGLVGPIGFKSDSYLKKRIQEALAAPSWSEGVKDAAMLLYLSLKAFNELRPPGQETLNLLEQNLFKLDERRINIINFHINKTEKIDYDLIKDYINHLIILYDKTANKNLSMKMFSKYMSIGLRTKDILYIGRDFKDIISNLMLEEREKVVSWLEKQDDDLRIQDVLLATYMTKKIHYTEYFYVINIDEELKTRQVEKKIKDIYGKIKCADKIRLLIDQDRIYFGKRIHSHKVCDFIDNILKREARINFNSNFREDYAKIINSWHPNRKYVSKEDMFLNSNHIGLYLYYEILTKWGGIISYFGHNIPKENKIHLYTRDKIIKNLHIHSIKNTETKLDFYLNKIESNNFPCEEIKCKLIMELKNIIENNYDKISEYFKDESKLIKVRKVILSNIGLFEGELNSRLIKLLQIDNKSRNMTIY